MIRRYLLKLTAWMNICSIIALVAILLIMFVDITLRYTIKVSILGAYEIIEYLMVIAITFCMAHTEMHNGHVKVSMLTERFGPRLYQITRSFGYLIQSVMLFFVMFANIQQAHYIKTAHSTSAIHKIPAYPFYYVIAVGFGIFGLVMLLQTIETICNSPRHDEDTFLKPKRALKN